MATQTLSDKRIREITAVATSHARQKGFHQEADDIAQDALLQILEGRRSHVRCIFVDYLRRVYGRYRYKEVSKRKSNATRFYLPINEETCGTEEMKTNVDFAYFQKQLKPDERAMVTLRYKWDMTEQEIGECFGVSESRISQRLKEIKRKLKKFASQADLLSQG